MIANIPSTVVATKYRVFLKLLYCRQVSDCQKIIDISLGQRMAKVHFTTGR